MGHSWNPGHVTLGGVSRHSFAPILAPSPKVTSSPWPYLPFSTLWATEKRKHMGWVFWEYYPNSTVTFPDQGSSLERCFLCPPTSKLLPYPSFQIFRLSPGPVPFHLTPFACQHQPGAMHKQDSPASLSKQDLKGVRLQQWLYWAALEGNKTPKNLYLCLLLSVKSGREFLKRCRLFLTLAWVWK